jgi:hypothetical protein
MTGVTAQPQDRPAPDDGAARLPATSGEVIDLRAPASLTAPT